MKDQKVIASLVTYSEHLKTFRILSSAKRQQPYQIDPKQPRPSTIKLWPQENVPSKIVIRSSWLLYFLPRLWFSCHSVWFCSVAAGTVFPGSLVLFRH